MAYGLHDEVSYMSMKFTSVSLETKSELVIAIDFGTTYTGVAYLHSGKVNGDDIGRIAENIDLIKSWPNTNESNAEKTPTILAYNTNPPIWGGSVKPRDEPQVAHFKLGLQRNAGSHYIPSAAGNTPSALAFLEPNWKHPRMPHKSAVDFAADYLGCVHKYVREVYFPRKFGNGFLRNQKISYVITVPAIWEDAAKDLTRQAAVRAGIPEEKLQLITEPEAAALFCATVCEQVDLKDGDRFLVCDAGGGTVDLISYLVVSRDPFSVEECSIGSGAACGAIYLHRGFEALLRQKLGSRANTILTPKRLSEALRYFEHAVKRAFNPFDESCETDFDVPLSGAVDVPSIGLEDGSLKLSKDDIKSVYDPIFNQIYNLIFKQMLDVEAKCHRGLKTLFLVGGLGSNLYLTEFLQSKLKSKIDIKRPDSGYSAIMRGAVLHKMGLNFVKERIMRKHYGVPHWRDFQAGDPQNLKSVSVAGDVVCDDVMKWYAKKRQRMANGRVVSFPFISQFTIAQYESDGPLQTTNALSVCESDEAPDYKNRSVRSLCTVTVDLRPLKPFTKKWGSGGYYYEVEYELGLTFGPELLFKLVRDRRVLGSGSAKYVQ